MFDIVEPFDLRVAHRHIVNVPGINRIFGLELVFVDAHNDILAAVNARLLFSCSRFNLEFGPAGIDRFGHAAHGFHFFNDGPRGISHVLREFFHHVAARPRVNHVGDVGFFLNDELGVAGNAA